MKNLGIGIQILEPTAPATVEAIVRAEGLGIDVAWLTHGGGRWDPVTAFAAAAVRTSRILLGTAIVPFYPRHPLALAGQAKALGQIAPGRFRLGIGPSHKPTIEGVFGIPYRKPIASMREYLQILKATLQVGGQVDFEGEFFRIHINVGDPVGVPVMASGLRWKSFEAIGELGDGGISWVSPLRQVERVDIPAMKAGAAKAGRPVPPMIMHIGVAVHENADEVRQATLKQFAYYPTMPAYQAMFVEAGFPEAATGKLSEAMAESFVVHGDESAVAVELRRIAAVGVDEVLCTVVAAGRDPKASADRTLGLLGQLSKAE